MISPPIEEALEHLYIHEVEGAEYPQGESTSAALKDASSTGLVLLQGERYRLTSEGRAAGRDVVRRHRLAERLLHDVLAAGGEARLAVADPYRGSARHPLAPAVGARLASLGPDHPLTRCVGEAGGGAHDPGGLLELAVAQGRR